MAVPSKPEWVAAQYVRYTGGYSWKWGEWGWLPLAKPYMSPAYYATWLANSQKPPNPAAVALYAKIAKYQETEYVHIVSSLLIDNGAAVVNKSNTVGDQVVYLLSGETPSGVKEPIPSQEQPLVSTYMMSKINGKWYVSKSISNGSSGYVPSGS
ncbi:MAG: hypothetical protein ACYDEP_02470 [Acidimicrobiales bacterium]